MKKAYNAPQIEASVVPAQMLMQVASPIMQKSLGIINVAEGGLGGD